MASAGLPGRIRIFSNNGIEIRTISIGKRELWSVDWQPSGSFIAFGSNGIAIWDSAISKYHMTLNHKSDVFSLNWSISIPQFVC